MTVNIGLFATLHYFAVLMLSITLGVVDGYGQETMVEAEREESGRHRITLGLGHTHLSQGKNVDGQTVWLPVPSWALNYDYRLTPKWRIGLQADFVMEKFVVEDDDGQELERERPIAVVPVALFEFAKHFSLVVGGGVEFEKEQNLGLSRLGIEYGVEIVNGWEAGASAVWDAKWGYYDSWGLEFTFSKSFGKKRRW